MTATLDGVTKKKAEPTAAEKVAEELVARAREQGLSLTGPDGLLKQLTKTVLETALNTIAAATEHARTQVPASQIPLIRNEIARLFATLIIQPRPDAWHRLRWSAWRRHTSTASKPATTSGKPGSYEDHGPPAGALAGPVRVRGGVAQPGAAELHGRVRDPPPEGPDGRCDPKLDPGPGVPAQKIVDDHPLDRFHLLLSDPVAAHLMWPEPLRGQPVGVQAAGPQAAEPAGLDHMNPVRGTLPEKPLTVLRRGGRHRPDASARAVPREPEHRRVACIDRPHQRLRLRIRGRNMRPEPAKRRVLAKMPQGERALSLIPRRRFPGQQVLRVVRVHHGQSSTLGTPGYGVRYGHRHTARS
jgi:hypothetical protein